MSLSFGRGLENIISESYLKSNHRKLNNRQEEDARFTRASQPEHLL